MDRPLGACIARISSPSKDCKEQYLCTYSLQLVASTAISETDGSLNHTIGRRGIKKVVRSTAQALALLRLDLDTTLPSGTDTLCTLANGSQSAAQKSTAASGRSRRASRRQPCASCPPRPWNCPAKSRRNQTKMHQFDSCCARTEAWRI